MGVVSVTRPPTSATNQSAWDMPVAKKLLVAKMVPAVVKLKRTQMVPTLVTNVSRLNVEPTITVQKQKNFVTMKPTNVTKLIAHHTLTVIKRMVTKNVLPTTVKRLVASLMRTAVPWLSVKPINVSMFNARPTVMILKSYTVRETSVFQCQESWTLSTKSKLNKFYFFDLYENNFILTSFKNSHS